MKKMNMMHAKVTGGMKMKMKEALVDAGTEAVKEDVKQPQFVLATTDTGCGCFKTTNPKINMSRWVQTFNSKQECKKHIENCSKKD